MHATGICEVLDLRNLKALTVVQIVIIWSTFSGEDHLVPSQRTPEVGEDFRGRNVTFDADLEIRA